MEINVIYLIMLISKFIIDRNIKQTSVSDCLYLKQIWNAVIVICLASWIARYNIPDPVLPQPDMWHSWYDEYGVASLGRHAAVTFSLNVIPVPLYGLSFTNAMS